MAKFAQGFYNLINPQMFIDNKYSKWYFSIIQRRIGHFDNKKHAKKILGYVEQHHVIPKSLGGTNTKENLVFLTAKEHFVCHHLLTKMCREKDHARAMRFALNKMTRASENQIRFTVTSRMFDKIRRDFAQDMSEINTGKKGYSPTQEERDKKSKQLKGVPKSAETRKNMCGPKPARIAHLKKINDSRKGKPMPESTKIKLRKPKCAGTSEKLSELRKGQVSAYDIIEKKIKRVSKEEFELLKNIRYVGQKSKIRFENNG